MHLSLFRIQCAIIQRQKMCSTGKHMKFARDGIDSHGEKIEELIYGQTEMRFNSLSVSAI